MIDASDVIRFAGLLESPIIEEPWQDEWSHKVAEEMRRNAPVRTGRLRDSIQVTSDGVEVEAPYGSYVEYGTSHSPSQPFAAPAVNRLVRQAAEDAGDLVIRHLT
jgi:HK97 gp10 family phage protein